MIAFRFTSSKNTIVMELHSIFSGCQDRHDTLLSLLQEQPSWIYDYRIWKCLRNAYILREAYSREIFRSKEIGSSMTDINNINIRYNDQYTALFLLQGTCIEYINQSSHLKKDSSKRLKETGK